MIVKLREGRANNLTDEESLAKIFIPCFYTALTTMVGFLSLLLSNIQPVIDFGKMMAVGVVINLIVSFVYIPFLIGLKGIAKSSEFSLSKIYYKYLYLNTKNLFKNFGVPLIFLFLPIFIYLSSGLKVENKFIDYVKSSSEIYKGLSLIDKKLGGTATLDIIIDAPEILQEDEYSFDDGFDDDFGEEFNNEIKNQGYWFTTENLIFLESIHDYLESRDEIGKVLSVSSGIKLAEIANNKGGMS